MTGRPAASPFRSRLIELCPFHYGWIILAAGTFGAFMTSPGQTQGVSAFFDPMAASLGLSRTTVSFAYTIGTLAGVLPAPLIGKWIDHRGPRVVVGMAAAALAAACAFMAVVHSAAVLLLGFAFLRGAALSGLSLVSLHIVNLWFVERRGRATAVASLGLAAGSFTFPVVANWLISAYGWRSAYLVVAGIVLTTMLPIGLVFFRDRPERFGLQPDAGLAPRRDVPVTPEQNATRHEALRTGTFWVLSAASFLSNAIGTGLLLHHFSLMAAAGIERTTAAAVFTPFAVVQAGAMLATGVVLDRVAPLRVVPMSMAMLGASAAGAVLVAGVGQAWLYAAGLGLAIGMHQAVNAMAYAHYFGRGHLGEIRGVTFLAGISGAAAGPLPFALSVERFGTYAAATWTAAALCVVVALTAVVHARRSVRATSRPDRS